jgi:hypothetical protein
LRYAIVGESLRGQATITESFSSLNQIREYIESRRVTKETVVESAVEEATKLVLIEMKLDAFYQVFPLPVEDLTWQRPDFLVPQIQVNGKYVILNPHHNEVDKEGRAVDREVRTWTGLQRVWGDCLENVILDTDGKGDWRYQMGGLQLREFGPRVWKMPNHGSGLQELKPVIKMKLELLKREGDFHPTYSTEKVAELLLRARRGRGLQEELVGISRNRSMIPA